MSGGRAWEQRLAGAVLALGVPALFALGAVALGQSEGPFPVVAWLVGVWLTKSTFAVRALGRAAGELRGPLAVGDLEGARVALQALSRRDPAGLDASGMTRAGVEALADNACDSVVAPLFYFAIGGLPAAMFYRAVTVVDALIGHRGHYEHMGKAVARLDDLLNFVPARMTALLLLLVGKWGARLDGQRAWRTVKQDARKAAGPNNGWPMAAMAGLLGVQLQGGIGEELGGAAGEDLIERAWRLVRLMALVTAALALAVLALRGV
jgi:adenosylcobinamide-phosphate synthase